jgi:hypothetical protein
MERTSETDLVKAELLHTVTEKRNILHTAQLRKATWIEHIWREDKTRNKA